MQISNSPSILTEICISCRPLGRMLSCCGSLEVNVVDRLMSMLEQHALQLEDLIEERTGQLVVEKHKVEALLHNLLPA